MQRPLRKRTFRRGGRGCSGGIDTQGGNPSIIALARAEAFHDRSKYSIRFESVTKMKKAEAGRAASVAMVKTRKAQVEDDPPKSAV